MFPARPLAPGRHGRSPLRLLAAAVLAAGVGGFAVHHRPAAAAPAVDTADMDLARTALAALDADPTLRDFNLVVSVVDRVAVVGGPVGSDAMKKRAEQLVAGVPGVRGVRNGCFVTATPEPLLFAADRPAPRPALPPVALPRKTGVAEAPAPEPDRVALAEPAERSVVARRPANPADAILLPPVASGVGGPAFAPYPTPTVLTGRPALAEAVEAVRRADPRFAGLRAELRGGEVVVTGTAARADDAWELADRLRAVPGVTRVAVGR